jgi:DNA-binding beta-propeller fold protein YncE
MPACFRLSFSVVCLVACGGHGAAAPNTSGSSPSPMAALASAPTPPAVAPTASAAPEVSVAAPAAQAIALRAEAVALPGADAPVALDYLFYEPQKKRVWVPAGGSGSVDVFDLAGHAFSRVTGFKTAEREGHGKKRAVGPSSGSVGDGYAYVGNRATSEVCAVELATLKLGTCLKLEASPDGVEYVAAKREVWVTAPQIQAILVLDASKPSALKQKSRIKLAGEPEGYAVDEARGLFLTNLEDKGSTLTIDLESHVVKDTWNAGCSSDGPRGIALDSARGLLFVACTDHVQALDMTHAGALLGKLDSGAGLDNLDYVAKTGLLYAAAGKAARLTVAHVGDHGEFSLVAMGETAAGARNAVADENGTAYVADAQGAHLLVLSAP